MTYKDSIFLIKAHRCLTLILILVLFGGFPANLFGDPPPVQIYTNNPVVATVDGEYLMMDDLKNAQIHDAMFQLHRMQSGVMKEKILQQLANKHPGFLDDDVPEVTGKEITQFYETTPGVKQLGTPGKMRDEIREYLERVYRESYIEKKYQYALNKKWVKIYLKPPSEFRVVAEVGSATLWNGGDSKKYKKVFILEYSDFQCPFCKRVQGTLKVLRKQYAKNVLFGYRHFPLPFHKEAKSLAEAVECARDQGRFWELQSILYGKSDDSQALTETAIVKMARQAGLKKLKDFKTCWKERKYKNRVSEDIREGVRLGIQGTPTFVLGLYDPENGTVSGEMFSGAVSESKFVEAIEKYLALSRAEAKLIR